MGLEPNLCLSKLNERIAQGVAVASQHCDKYDNGGVKINSRTISSNRSHYLVLGGKNIWYQSTVLPHSGNAQSGF